MARVTLIKYLQHLISEINLHERDQEITDDEMIRFSSELKKFRLLIKNSDDLPQFLKDELLPIDFHYDLPKVRKRNFLFLFKLFFTAPYHVRMKTIEHEKRLSELLDVAGDLKRVYNKALYIQDIDKCYIG